MTVRDLMVILQHYNPDDLVVMSDESGECISLLHGSYEGHYTTDEYCTQGHFLQDQEPPEGESVPCLCLFPMLTNN